MATTKHHFELCAYGDHKPISRHSKKTPGQLICIDDRGLAGRNHRLILEANPSTGDWVLYSVDSRGHQALIQGKFTDAGVVVKAAEAS